MSAPARLPRTRACIATAVLIAPTIIGFAPTFDGLRYLVPSVGALFLGVAVAVIGAVRRRSAIAVALLAVLAFFVFGGPLALPETTIGGFVPTGATLGGLATGTVTGWSSLLTRVPPIACTGDVAVVPLVLVLVATVVTASLALRIRRRLWTLVPALAGLLLQIALGTSTAAAPAVQAAVFAGAAVLWLCGGIDRAPSAAHAAGRRALDRRGMAGAVVIALGVGAGAFAVAAAPAEDRRAVLRDAIVPPFDVHAYASPLQSYRRYVRDFADEPLFTLDRLPEGARVRLATLDAYTGVVYDVAGDSSGFVPLRDDLGSDVDGEQESVTVTVGAYAGVWVPTVGTVSGVEFSSDDPDLGRSAVWNAETETLATPDGVTEGDSYTLDVVVGTRPDAAELDADEVADVSVPDPVVTPDGLADLAAEITADAETPAAQMRALAAFFAEEGTLSHGLDGETPSRAGHGAERIATLLAGDPMVGDDEQYAVAMSLMADSLGIPSRVVLGFYPDQADARSPYAATGSQAHVWVEVAFAEAGWVAFDPLAEDEQPPRDPEVTTESQSSPTVVQPQSADRQDDADESVTSDEARGEEQPAAPSGMPILVVVAGSAVVVALIVAIVPAVIVLALKRRRRRVRRRAPRTADRLSGGWDELRDRAVDRGIVPTRREAAATRGEEAVELATALAADAGAFERLAAEADAGVFGRGEPSAEEVESFWSGIEAATRRMDVGRGRLRRLRARLSQRSLRRGRHR